MWVMDGRFRQRYSAEAVQTVRQTIPHPAAATGIIKPWCDPFGPDQPSSRVQSKSHH